jgi:DNA adenine methylase
VTKIAYLQWGGKTDAASWIVSHFPRHRVYVEPFCGSCAVLFAKPRSEVEIVNDLDGRITNMYEQIRSRPKELAALLWATQYSQANWRGVKTDDEALEDARLLMAEGKQCINGKTFCMQWKANTGLPRVWANWFLRVLPAAARLKTVQVLNKDAVEVMKRVAPDEDALIYADPPYTGHEAEYDYSVDYQAMIDVLNGARAKVIVSEYPEAAPLWNGWRKVEKHFVSTAGAHSGKTKDKIEVLFMNFDAEKKRGFGLT